MLCLFFELGLVRVPIFQRSVARLNRLGLCKHYFVVFLSEVVRGIMQSGDDLCHGFTKLRIPLQVSVHVGKSWAHMNTWSP